MKLELLCKYLMLMFVLLVCDKYRLLAKLGFVCEDVLRIFYDFWFNQFFLEFFFLLPSINVFQEIIKRTWVFLRRMFLNLWSECWEKILIIFLNLFLVYLFPQIFDVFLPILQYLLISKMYWLNPDFGLVNNGGKCTLTLRKLDLFCSLLCFVKLGFVNFCCWYNST